MAENRSYIFFRFTSAASEGSLGKPLTPLVSLATDPNLLPLGAVAVLHAPLSAQSGTGPLRGIVLAQDAGADIQGCRLDLYLGSGERAERLEATLRTPATLHLLVSKSALRARP
jgi:membrane-bound lytic murein transglycosylase A